MNLKPSKSNDYNNLAKYYSWLSQLVFGQDLIAAQREHLTYLNESKKVLFIGGGNNSLLNEILSLHPHLEVTYLDQSKQMIKMATSQVELAYMKRINFIEGTEEDLPNENYDAIISFFFLDLFQPLELSKVCKTLNSKLDKNGLWFVADFLPPKTFHQKLIEKTMFAFLKLSTNISASRINPIQEQFNSNEFKLLEQANFKKGFIFSSVYRRNN